MADDDPALLPCVETTIGDRVVASVVWLHGLGADGHDFEPIVPLLGLPPDAGVRFVFPHAPAIPVTLNGGMVMPAWYDIRDDDLGRRHDEKGIRASARAIEALLEREAERGTPPERTVLAGFSQGGAMALHVGLRHPRPLAGLLALSAYLLLPDALRRERHPANAETPIHQAHGLFDPMVPLARGEDARDRLRAEGHDVDWRTWPMGHEVCAPQIQVVGAWLASRLSREEGGREEVVGDADAT